MSLAMQLKAQQGYKKDDIITDFRSEKILNGFSSNGRLSGLQRELTIIDFFGTWCTPCIRALPVLADIKKEYGDKISVVMVSVETEAKLQRFITGRKDFTFPVIVDADKKITGLFQPTALPYTVVINKNNEVLAITEAAAINAGMIAEWMGTNKPILPKAKPAEKNIIMKEENMAVLEKNTLLQLSQDFIYASKTGNETLVLEKQLANLSFDSLKTMLQSNDDKKAFWINLYNGFIQAKLKKDPAKYKSRSAFFTAKDISVAGKTFSLDDIEHGILRRSKIKWSLGYLNKLFPGKKEKVLRVKDLDPRIHFALNCGAKSCPPIAFYTSDKINDQLDLATRAYLSSEAIYNPEKNTLQLPAIMGWFRHDFKGKKNMLLLAKNYGGVPESAQPSISFAKYDWSLYLNNYSK